MVKAKTKKRARMYEVFVKYRRDGIIKVKAKNAAEAVELAEAEIEDAWNIEDVADWCDVDKCDVDILHADPAGRRR